jgi:hypothetical protein
MSEASKEQALLKKLSEGVLLSINALSSKINHEAF